MGNEIAQLNVIIDVLSGWSKNLEEMTSIFGKAGKQVLERKNAESSTKHLSYHKQTVHNHDRIKIKTIYLNFFSDIFSFVFFFYTVKILLNLFC